MKITQPPRRRGFSEKRKVKKPLRFSMTRVKKYGQKVGDSLDRLFGGKS